MIAIGNGESRLSIDIEQINDIKIGCNAVVRDYTVDHLVCVDKKMVRECLSSHQKKYNKIYTRKEWISLFSTYNIIAVPSLPYQGNKRTDNPTQWGSGVYAVLIAARLSETVKMIGFDLYSKDSFVNNCYKGTENYDASAKRAVDSRYWVHQISKVFEYFPNRKFVTYQTPDWQLPEKWILPNVRVDKISNFTYT